MRSLWILIAATLGGGCATQRPLARVTPSEPAKPIVRESAVTKVVETRYEVRSYRDADSPGVRHDAHAVYRSTRVPARTDALETAPRTAFAPVSYEPLPASTELSAELAAQREITAELRSLQSRMATIEQQAKNQYGTLVDQTAETVKVRRQLETERARIMELEAKQRATAPASPTPTGPAVAADTKW